MKRPVVLFTSPVLSYPALGGPALRIQNTIKALGRVAELHLFARVPRRGFLTREALRFLWGHFASVRFAPYNAGLSRRVINTVASRLTGQALWNVGMETPVAFNAFLHRASQVDASVAWLGYGNISYPLARHIKEHSRLKVVVDTDSIWSRYVARGAEYAKNPDERARILASAEQKTEEERLGTALADLTTAVSEVDAEYYRALAPSPERVRILSNAVDMDAYAPQPVPRDIPTPFLLLAGSFASPSPMEDAARWYLSDIMPRVLAAQPDMHLVVAGAGSQEVLRDVHHPRVHILGRVPSMVPFVQHATATLVPLRYESGTRFKILEAGACRAPVVSTTLGAEGIPLEDGRHLLLADTPEAFASAIARVAGDPPLRARLGAALHQRVTEVGSLQSLSREAEQCLQTVLRLPSTHPHSSSTTSPTRS